MTCSRPEYKGPVQKWSWKRELASCKAHPSLTGPPADGFIFLKLFCPETPAPREGKAALEHPLVGPCAQGTPPSRPHTPGPREKPGGAGPGHAPARPAGGGSEQPRPPRCHPASPHHGCRALLFRFARLGIRDSRRGPGFMSRSQGPRQGPLAPDAGREVGPGGGGCSRGRAGTRCPRPASPWSTPPLGSGAAGLE